MDDFNLLYIVLGVIYLLTKFFGKKPQKKTEEEMKDFDNYGTYPAPAKPQPSFEDLFRELTGGSAKNTTPAERMKPLKPTKPEPPISEKISQRYNEYDLSDDELTGIVPHKSTKHKTLAFERHSPFKIGEEENEIREKIHEFLADHDGLRKAIVLKEILNRKY